VWIGLGVVVALAVVVIAGAIIMSRANPFGVITTDIEVSTTIRQAEDLRQAGKTDQAIAKVKAELAKPLPSGNQFSLHVALGGLYISNKNFKDALGEYRQAAVLQDNLDYRVAVGIAQSSEVLKDYKTALKFYEKAVDLPVPSGQAIDVNAAIKRVQPLASASTQH
jgi:tetratricopeptide (TPR) repeat protein